MLYGIYTTAGLKQQGSKRVANVCRGGESQWSQSCTMSILQLHHIVASYRLALQSNRAVLVGKCQKMLY